MLKKIISILFIGFTLTNISVSQNGWYVVGSVGSSCDIFFIDAQTGWTVYYAQGLYKTTDGGTSWVYTQTLPMSPIAVCFSSPLNGAATGGDCGGNCPIWTTGSGGAYWMSCADMNHLSSHMMSITYYNGNYWLCGSIQNNNYPNPTYTGIYEGCGTTYEYSTSFTLKRIRAGTSNFYAVGDSGYVLRGSGSYLNVGNYSANLTGVSFHDANTGYVVGGSYMYKSTDNCASWTRIYPLTPAGTYNDVWFANADTGWVACLLSDGVTGAMLYTSNGGTNWVQQYSGLSGNDICFVNSETGWVLCGSSVLKTTTGGIPGVPPIPGPSSPPNNSTGLPLADTLSWSISTGATSYRLQVATDSLFSNLFLNDSTISGNSRYVTGLNGLTYYWWRVNAKNSGGTSSFSSPFKFRTIGAPNIPTALFPANNATNQPTSLTFLWSKAYDQTNAPATNYWYELCTDTTIAAVVKDSTLTDTLRPVSGLLNNQNYWWRVKAKNIAGWCTFSAYSKFTTIVAPPPVPTLLRPPNGSGGNPHNPWLVWTNSAGATSYRVQIASDTIFSTLLADTTVSIDSVQVTLGYNMTVYWRARASNVGGNSAWTAIWYFSTGPVGILSNNIEIPKVFKLYGNYPNPFNPASKIKFDIPKTSNVKLIIYDVIGNEVVTLVNQALQPGTYEVEWDGSNYASGVYFYRIEAGSFVSSKKMMLMK